MEMENPSNMEVKEQIICPSTELLDKEHIIWGQQQFNQNNIKYQNKRRLVISAVSTEPILIEIRPNFQDSMIDSLICNSTQCDIIPKQCQCEVNSSSKHMNLMNDLYEIIHNTNTSVSLGEYCFQKQDVTGNKSWLDISSQALDKIKQLKEELHKEIQESEKYALAMTNMIGLEEQFEAEKNMRKQDCEASEGVILELRNQVTNQAEEIRRLWTENLAIESVGVDFKLDESKQEYDVQKKNQRILELELHLAKEMEEHKKTLVNQEIKYESFQSKIDELEKIQIAALIEKDEHNNDLKVKIEELEKEKLQYQEKTQLLISKDDKDETMFDYTTLEKERNMLKEELEKMNNSYNHTTHKLRHNIAKRRRLEAESEGEKQQRSNLAAALYELENEVEETVSIINSLQFHALESMSTLTNDLENFQEVLEKYADSSTHETKSLSCNDNEKFKTINSNNEQNPSIQNIEVTNSNIEVFKVIPDAKSTISKLTNGNEKLLTKISMIQSSIRRALKTHNRQVQKTGKEMTSKLETIETEKDFFNYKNKALHEENKNLEVENSKLQDELSFLKSTKSKFNVELKDLEKEIEDLQEALRNLREENRKLLKETKWKSVGKQGGYQESLIVQEWEKKLQKMERDYEILRHLKKDLVKEKHHLEDELDRAAEKGYRGSGGSEDRKLEDELFNMTQERNKLRKIKITLAIENVSLKESLAELRTKADALETECETLLEWKEKVQKLEEECEDLRDWKSKAEALEMECEDLRDSRMQIEALEAECENLRDGRMKAEAHENESEGKRNSNVEELGEESEKILHNGIDDAEEEPGGHIRHCSQECLGEECKNLRECKVHLEEECQSLRQRMDQLELEYSTLREFKAKIESNSDENHDQVDEDKSSDERSKAEAGAKTNLRRSKSMDAEPGSVQEYKEKIASLEQENARLCQNHQAALDKQWDVIEADLKAFEAKVEELENECESVRRDHLSSMVENAELAREKDRLLTLYNDQKYNYEILETANECLQKDQEQKEAERMKERNDFNASIENLSRQVMELESTFSERLRQQAANYAHSLAPKSNINNRDTVTLTRQEYDILLAEKAVMLQERDSAHKKLCCAEVQNLQLSARIECLRQEVPRANQGYNEKESDAEVFLAQDVVNLRSMLTSLEEELATANRENNKMLGELNEDRDALARLQVDNQNLTMALEEFQRRSSLEHIHSAASSLKEQLGKASKEKDLIKDQLNKVTKEKEQLAKVANERDKVIFSLKDQITKFEEERIAASVSLKAQLAEETEANARVPSKAQDRLKTVARERDDAREKMAALQHELESLNTKISLVNNDLTKRTESWMRERDDLEDKCKRIEVELANTKEALQKGQETLAMTKKKMQDALQEAIKEKAELELVAKEEVKNAQAQASQLRDDFLRTKQLLDEKSELTVKEVNNIVAEKNILAQELLDLKGKVSWLQKENQAFTSELAEFSGKTSCNEVASLNQNLHDFGATIQSLNEQLANLDGEKHQLTLAKQSLMNERDHLLAAVTKLETEKEAMSNRFEQDLHVEVSSVKALLATAAKEKEQLANSERSLQKKFDDLCVTVQSLNEQLASLSHEKNRLVHAKEAVTHERDDLLQRISSLNKEEEKANRSQVSELVQGNTDQNCAEEKEECVWTTTEVNSQEQLNELITTVREMKLKQSALGDEISVLTQEKERLNQERGNLLEELSSLRKEKDVESGRKGKRRWNSKGPKDEIVSLISDKERLIASEASLKQQLTALEKKEEDKNSSLMYEKISLLKDRDNLNAEIALLQKEKTSIEKKLERVSEQSTASMQDIMNALATAERELDAEREHHGKLMEDHVRLKEENAKLVEGKGRLAQESENLKAEIAVIKKDNGGTKEKLTNEMALLLSLKSELSVAMNEKDRLAATELSLIQQLNLLKTKAAAQDKQQTKLESDISVLSRTMKTLVQERAQQQNELSALLQANEALAEERDGRTRDMTTLRGEKEALAKENGAILLEKNSMVASTISLQSNVESLTKRLLSLNGQVADLVEQNENLRTEMQAAASLESEKTVCLSKVKNGEAGTSRDQERAETVTLEKKLVLLEQEQAQLAQEKYSLAQQNKSLQQQCDNLSAKISVLKVEGEILKSSAESKETERVISTESSAKQQVAILQTSVNTLKEQQTDLTKENYLIIQENKALTEERDRQLASISSLKSQHEAILAQELKEKGVATSESSLNQKFEELVKTMDVLNKSQENNASELELMMQGTESLTKERDNLQATVTSLEAEQAPPNSKSEHHPLAEVDHSAAVKEAKSSKLEASLRDKLEDLAKTIATLKEGLTASTKGREQMIPEMTTLKRDCQKLHTALSAAERDKETLMKRVMESRCASERLSVEHARLQRELAEVEKKLARTTAERDNARHQVAELQRLLSNQQRFQHMAYSMEKVESLEAENRCLRMEKDAIQERLNKCSMELETRRRAEKNLKELEGNYRFRQQMPSMAKFVEDRMNSHPSLHNTSLYLSGDPGGRPPPSFPQMLHQQWPM